MDITFCRVFAIFNVGLVFTKDLGDTLWPCTRLDCRGASKIEPQDDSQDRIVCFCGTRIHTTYCTLMCSFQHLFVGNIKTTYLSAQHINTEFFKYNCTVGIFIPQW